MTEDTGDVVWGSDDIAQRMSRAPVSDLSVEYVRERQAVKLLSEALLLVDGKPLTRMTPGVGTGCRVSHVQLWKRDVRRFIQSSGEEQA